MLKNADQKIIIWSKFFLFLGIAISVILGVALIWLGIESSATVVSTHHHTYEVYSRSYASGITSVIAGFLVIIFGSLFSWVTALLLRAFGDLTADTRAIRDHLEYRPRVVETIGRQAQEEPREAPAYIEVEEPFETEAEEPVEAKPKAPAKKRTRKPARAKAAKPVKTEESEKAEPSTE